MRSTAVTMRLLAFTGALACLLGRPALASSTTGECWQLTQESCTIGKINLYVSDKAVRWNSPRLALTFIIRAPNWKLMGYNENTKKFMELTPQQMEALARKGSATKQAKPIDEKLVKKALTPLKTNTTKICGLKTIELHMPHEMGQSHSGAHAANMEKIPGSNVKQYDPKKWQMGDEDVWFASDIKLPISIADFMGEKMQGAAAKSEIASRHPLLRSIHIGYNGSPAMAIDTTGCKKLPITPGLFDMPKGYTKTDNEMALLMGVDDSDMDVLGSSSATPKKRPF